MLQGRLLRLTALAFVASLGIAFALSALLHVAGVMGSPLLLTIMLSATSLGVVIPVLKDSGAAESQFGQVVLAGASIADIVTVVLLSLFFSEKSSGLGAKLVLLGGFALLVLASAVTLARAGRSMRISRALLQLQDTSAQRSDEHTSELQSRPHLV